MPIFHDVSGLPEPPNDALNSKYTLQHTQNLPQCLPTLSNPCIPLLDILNNKHIYYIIHEQTQTKYLHNNPI